jgi:hypothetical protein
MARAKLQRELQVERETAFGDGATFGGSELSTKVIGEASVNGAKAVPIANENTTQTGGSSGQIPGTSMAIDDAATFEHWAEGLGTAAGDGVAPTATALSELLSSWAQQPAAQMVAPTPPGTPTWYTTGSTIEPLGSTSTTLLEIKALDADFFELPTANSIGFVGATLSDGVHWRPYIWDTATNSAELLIALPSIPADSSVVYGAINFPRAESWDSALPFPLATRWIGDKTIHNVEFQGSIYDLSIPEVGPRDVPRFAFTSRGAGHTRDVVDNRNYPTNDLATVFKQGKLLIAEQNGTTLLTTCAFRVTANFSGAVEPDECINDTNDFGISGYSRIDSVPELVVQLGREAAPPAALTSTTWIDAAENNQDTTDDCQVFVQYGGPAGRTILAYLPYCRAEVVEYVEVNKLAYQVVTFRAKDGQFTTPAPSSQTLSLTCALGQG